jgi:hypothetical protein
MGCLVFGFEVFCPPPPPQKKRLTSFKSNETTQEFFFPSVKGFTSFTFVHG